jgi:hypothetical protein
MGLKNAGSYFQEKMSQEVLAGLLYIICEVYMDDILVYGKDFMEFIHNLKEVFQRFREKNITLNPDKCHFGLETVEFVGHRIDAKGISFTTERLHKFASILRPINVVDMQKFLGLANYFRDHVQNHSLIVRPLQDMIKNKSQKSKLEWSEKLITNFEEVKDKVLNCPKLFFMNEKAESFVHTDASDFGVGGYIFQVDNYGKEYPIAFVSKSLTGAQLRWSTPEKESYAIVYTLFKYDYLLRDVKFHLKTDHQNLTYIESGTSQKVQRWKLFIQGFNFDINHIKGKDNIPADCLSRLCLLSLKPSDDNSIPQEILSKIQDVHNDIIGHLGVEKTVAKLLQQGIQWQYMRFYVQKFIKECSCCQKMSYIRIPIITPRFIVSSLNPMEKISIDSMGPLPESGEGHKHIIVIIDNFSRFVEMYPSKDVSAKSAARALLQHSGRYGFAQELISDQGTQFVNQSIEELVKLLGMKHTLTMAYSKQENAIVERVNKEILRHLKAIIFNKNIVSEWHEYLPIVQRIINSTTHMSIGVSPASILFGNAINLDRGLLINSSDNKSRSMFEWADDMIDKQSKIIQLAQETQFQKQVDHLTDDQTEFSGFQINSHVLAKYPNQTLTGSRPPTKFHTFWRGPFRVERIEGVRYIVVNLVNNKLEEFHIKDLKPFLYDPQVTNPGDIAMKDSQQFYVEKILAHKGTISKRSEMTFHVRWLYHNEESDSWEPWGNLKDNLVLHNYLRINKMASIIPPRYRNNQDPIPSILSPIRRWTLTEEDNPTWVRINQTQSIIPVVTSEPSKKRSNKRKRFQS